MSYSVPDLRAYLRGAWAVERTMLDRSTGERGSFAGAVTFSGLADDDGALLQHEEGTVRWGAHEGPATREYLWRPTSSLGAMEVFFPDGRFFHTVELSTTEFGTVEPSTVEPGTVEFDAGVGAAAGTGAEPWRAQHWCDPDTYRVTYTPMGPDELRYVWDVSGPAKDLLLSTTLRRHVRRV